MKELKVVSISDDIIKFEGGVELEAVHVQDCCEHHYLSLSDLTIDDFDGLTFDLSAENGEGFFNRVEGYGIELLPNHGHAIRIPGYGSNNGYYSSNLTLEVRGDGKTREFNISECQKWDEY